MNWLPPCSSPELMKPCSASFGPFVVISQYVLDAHNQELFCRLVQSSEKNKGPSHTSSAPSWRDISSVNVDPDRVAAGPGQTGPGLLLGPAQRRGPPFCAPGLDGVPGEPTRPFSLSALLQHLHLPASGLLRGCTAHHRQLSYLRMCLHNNTLVHNDISHTARPTPKPALMDLPQTGWAGQSISSKHSLHMATAC